MTTSSKHAVALVAAVAVMPFALSLPIETAGECTAAPGTPSCAFFVSVDKPMHTSARSADEFSGEVVVRIERCGALPCYASWPHAQVICAVAVSEGACLIDPENAASGLVPGAYRIEAFLSTEIRAGTWTVSVEEFGFS